MASGVRITLVGGGSVQWGPPLITDLMLTQSLTGGRLVLYDIDHPAMEQMSRLARRIAAETRSGWEIEVQDDLDQSLKGSDFVLFCIAQGGLEAFRHDLEIPWRHGIPQPVGDTVGPGGISRALRHIPVALDIALRMETWCPQAWFINLTNPMTVIIRAVDRETSIRTIGLCHELSARRLATLLGVSSAAIEYQAAGVNHLPWVLRLRVNGQDGFRLLRKRLAAHGTHDGVRDMPETPSVDTVFIDRSAVKLSLFQVYDYLPGAGDRHLAEFFPAFLSAESDYGRAHGVELTTIQHRYELLARRRQWVAQKISQPEPLNLSFSAEQLAGVVSALWTGERGRFVVNIPNLGQVDNLPRQVVVERQADLGAGGVEPISVGALPTGVLQVLASRVWQQETIVDAAVRGAPNLVLQALMADPMVHSWETARLLCDEFFAIHSQYLPQFAGKR